MKTIRKWMTGANQITRLVLSAALLFSAALSGCGESGSGAATDSGDVLISLTDAPGDFLRYEVDVLSIKLTKANGTEIETLPVTARIDFSQYVDLEELVTTATIPSGLYTHVTLALDYTNANIEVEVNGVATPATVQDGDGNPITTLESKVRLDTQRPLLIVPGVPAHLSLDFDLKISNQVDIAASPPVVTVEPILLADINPEKPKRNRVRGPLLSINEVEETFQMAIHPFHHRLDHNRNFGKLTVKPLPEAIYHIDDMTAEGSAGFTLLAQKPILTAVIVLGEWNVPERVFLAREVFAGSSVPGGERDAVRGSVIARVGDTLTVRGGTLIRAEGALVLRQDVTVRVGPNTKVVKQGEARDANPLGKDDLSIGQKVVVFGTVTGTDLTGLVVDATSGLVRMKYSTVTGTVNAVNPGEVVAALQQINRLPVAAFDFAGTGRDPNVPSDPANYHINTGVMTLGLSAGDPIRIRGHVNGFAQAPPDFIAQTVIDVSDVRARMIIGWDPATPTPFFSATETGLEIDLTGVGTRRHVIRGHVATELTADPHPMVVPSDKARGRYAIRQARSVSIHSDFGNFVNDLNRRLREGAVLKRLHAKGQYRGAVQTLAAHTATVLLQ